MPASIRAGDVLADRYRMVDLLSETEGGRFWRAEDEVLRRQVAVHMITASDERADGLMAAARRSASLVDRRNLRVLDADRKDGLCYVVNEWGTGESLDTTLAQEGPLPPRRAAWLVAEVADTLSVAHETGRAHGRLVPANVLVDENGQVRIIGFAVDAALHGLPTDDTGRDVRDLVAVLYAALTGKWPGDHESRVPSAPRDHGQLLRPRQVRAGIPRALDLLCEEVLCQDEEQPPGRGAAGRGGLGNGLGAGIPGLGHRSHHDVTTAVGVRDCLEEFLGDVATGAQVAPAATPPAAAGARAGTTAGHVDVPTEAGMPVFHDEDVEWLRARSNPPPPPPPFEEPAERPLFAPDPEDGTPVRRPRPPRPAPDSGEYWPWDTSTGHGGHGTGHGQDSGLLTAVPPDQVPGRRWMRLAWIVGLAALVLLSVVAAYQLGGGGLGDDPDEDEPSGETSSQGPTGEPTPFEGLAVTDFDPQGDPPEENPDLAPLAVDGDPGTSWRSLTYDQQFGPAGLKTGIGLQVDLGEARQVRRVEITVIGGAPTTAEVYLTEQAPDQVEDLDPQGSGSDPQTIVVDLDEAVEAQFVTVWLTSVPPVEGGFRGEVAEIVVSG